MNEPLNYMSPDQASSDASHLQILAICHYVWGPMVILFSSCFIFHGLMGIWMVTDPEFFNGTQGGPPPPAFVGYMFAAMGFGTMLIGWTIGALNLYSARCLQRRRGRVFSLIMAGINCLAMPLGTILGVFTFVVLLRSSVATQYEIREGSADPAIG